MKKPSAAVAKKPAVADQSSPPPKMPGRSRSSGDVSGLADAQALGQWFELHYIPQWSKHKVQRPTQDGALHGTFATHSTSQQNMEFLSESYWASSCFCERGSFFSETAHVFWVKLKMFLDDTWLVIPNYRLPRHMGWIMLGKISETNCRYKLFTHGSNN